MAEWNCETASLPNSRVLVHNRWNGTQKYTIRAEHISVHGSSAEIEIKFRDDWNKTTQTMWLKAGQKAAYIDPDGAAWQVVVNGISGDGLWAEVDVSICYYGGPDGDITNVNHDDKEKSGGLTGVGPDIRNIGDQKGTFDVKFYEGATHLRTASTGRMEAGAFIQNMVEMFTMPDRDFMVTVKLYLAGTSVLHDQKTVTVRLETITVLPPVISSISWSPKGTSHRIGAGAEFRGASGTRLKVNAVGPSTTPSLQVEEAQIEIGTASSKTYKRGESFVLDGKGYTILHVVSDWECSGVTIGENDSTDQHPAIGEKIDFAANVVWNDDGATAVSRKVEWFYLKPPSESITQAYAENINNWTHFAEGEMVEHTFNDAGDVDILYLKVIARNKANQTGEFGRAYCGVGQFNVWGGSDGFEITVVDAVGQDDLTIMTASLVPGTNAWMTGVVVMRWDGVTNQTYFGTRNELGCAYSSPQPDSCGSMAMVVGQRYAIFRSTSFIAVVPGESVFELESGRTAVTTDRAYLNFLENSICGWMGISGSECTSFVAEFTDPVFIGNYASILTTGKDMFGNERELTWLDHIALPFAIAGTLIPVPVGAVISKGLGAASKLTGKIFTAATNEWVRHALFKTPGKLLGDLEDRISFSTAIVQIGKDAAEDVVKSLDSGDTVGAQRKLQDYLDALDLDDAHLPDYWSWTEFNHLIKEKIADMGTYMSYIKSMKSYVPRARAAERAASKASPTANERSIIVDAARDADVMEMVGKDMYGALKTLDDVTNPVAKANKVKAIENVLKNSPEISIKLIDEYKTFFDRIVVDGASLQDEWMTTISNHAIVAPDDIIGLFKSTDHSIVSKLSDGTTNQVLGNFIDVVKKHHDDVKELGEVKAETWVAHNAEIAKKAMKSPDPAKMSDTTHITQEVAANQGDLIEDYCGGHTEPCYSHASDEILGVGKTAADDIVEQTEGFYFDSHSLWAARAKQYVNLKYSNAMRWFDNLSDANQEKAAHGMIAATMFFAVAVLYKLYTDAGPQSLNHNLFTGKMETAYWPCFHSCKDGRANDLANDIDAYEAIIEECAANLDKYKTVLEDDGTYNIFHRTLQLHQSNLAHFKSCLAGLTPTGTIRCTSNIAGFHVWVDGSYKGHSYATNLKIIDAVKVGTHEVKIEKGPNYSPTHCIKSVSVTDGGIKTVDCQMTKIGDCSEVTSVNMYLDPLSPLIDETISFNGSAKSNDPITGWEWDFDDGSPNKTGQAVTHTYSSEGIYEVTLTVTNECGNTETTARNLTISEEGVEEAGTLMVEKPINAVNKLECGRAWEAVIYVDDQTLGKTTPFAIPFGTDPYIGGYGGQCGEHDIKIILSDYDTIEKTISIEDGDSKTWTPEMYLEGTTPPPATQEHDVSFSVPVGSTTYVDGKLLGSTSVGRLATILRGLVK